MNTTIIIIIIIILCSSGSSLSYYFMSKSNSTKTSSYKDKNNKTIIIKDTDYPLNVVDSTDISIYNPGKTIKFTGTMTDRDGNKKITKLEAKLTNDEHLILKDVTVTGVFTILNI